MYRLTTRVRVWILTPIRQTVAYPESALVESFVLGTSVVLPEDIRQSVKTMGIAHVIAVSGSHLTLLISLLVVVVKTKKSTIKTIILISMLVMYTTLVGWQPAVSRALYMSACILLGKTVFHRQVTLSRSLLASAVLMLVVDPWVVLNIGWQLSVLATAGICWLYPVLLRVSSRRLPHTLALPLEVKQQTLCGKTALITHRLFRFSFEATMASLAAMACIWPILITSFGSWSWGSLLSSTFLWWLFPLVISSCFVGVIVVRLLTVLNIYPAFVQICSSLLLEWPVRSITWLFDRVQTLHWLEVSTGKWPTFIFFLWYLVVVLVMTANYVFQRRRSLRGYDSALFLEYGDR